METTPIDRICAMAPFLGALLSGGIGSAAQAELAAGTVLVFDPGVEGCVVGGTWPDNCDYGLTGVLNGSWFALDNDGDGILGPEERIAMSPYQGLRLDAVQQASGSHGGAPDGSEFPGIDQPWEYEGETGMHQTVSPVTEISGGSGSYQLDFSGWSADWNGGEVPLGGDPSVVWGNAYSDGTGVATITCSTADCSPGSSFTLDYEVMVGTLDLGLFLPYQLHLEGKVALVPLPPALWLFGSGLLGVIGISQTRFLAGRVRITRLGTTG